MPQYGAILPSGQKIGGAGPAEPFNPGGVEILINDAPDIVGSKDMFGMSHHGCLARTHEGGKTPRRGYGPGARRQLFAFPSLDLCMLSAYS
jgi:hypothetical protein